MSRYHGDFSAGKTIRMAFNTNDAAGAPITLAGTPVCRVYKDSGTTQHSTTYTPTVDFDAVTGLHEVVIDTSADGTFYSAGSDFRVVLQAGTVGGTSVVGALVGSFSLANRSALRPTTADRTLDVSATGEAGVDWANVGAPTTTLNLSGTTVKTATDVEADTQDLQSRTVAALVSGNVPAKIMAVDSSLGSTAGGRAEATMVAGTVTASTTPTASTCSATVSITPTAVDQFKGRVVIFAADTTTTALRGQATDITASTAPGGGATVLTFTALTNAPATGDIFVVI
jgi:hypothetical protein